MAEKSYIRKEVAQILKIRPSVTEVYVKQGIVTPDIENPTGKGTRRRFSKRNILEIAIAQKLVHFGLSLQVIGGIFRYWRRNKNQDKFWQGAEWDESKLAFLEIGSAGNPEDGPYSVRMLFLPSAEVTRVRTPPLGKNTNYLVLLNVTALREKIQRL